MSSPALEACHRPGCGSATSPGTQRLASPSMARRGRRLSRPTRSRPTRRPARPAPAGSIHSTHARRRPCSRSIVIAAPSPSGCSTPSPSEQFRACAGMRSTRCRRSRSCCARVLQRVAVVPVQRGDLVGPQGAFRLRQHVRRQLRCPVFGHAADPGGINPRIVAGSGFNGGAVGGFVVLQNSQCALCRLQLLRCDFHLPVGRLRRGQPGSGDPSGNRSRHCLGPNQWGSGGTSTAIGELAHQDLRAQAVIELCPNDGRRGTIPRLFLSAAPRELQRSEVAKW